MKFVLLLALFVAAVAAVPAEKNSKDVQASPVIMPEPTFPEVVEELPVPQGTFGEIFNDGSVHVSVNAPGEPGMLATLQSWFNMVVNYINGDGVESSHLIV